MESVPKYDGDKIRVLAGKYKGVWGTVVRWIPNPYSYIVDVLGRQILVYSDEIERL